MITILRTLLFLAAIPTLLFADCQPRKDSRKPTHKAAGIEVVDLILSGASSVDVAELRKITQDMIGSCFDDKPSLAAQLYSIFRSAGYVSVNIEDLDVESLKAENTGILPTPVQVRANVIEGQKCPTDLDASYHFLLDHRSDSLKIDPNCVDSAFAALDSAALYKHNRLYTKALTELLDFERVDENPDFNHHFVQYPASEALHFPEAVPYLVDAIKQTDNELVRKNAVDSLLWVQESRECMPATVTRLTNEAEKPETTTAQKARLQMAAEDAAGYIRELHRGPAYCRFEDGKPATEQQVLNELDRLSSSPSVISVRPNKSGR